LRAKLLLNILTDGKRLSRC